MNQTWVKGWMPVVATCLLVTGVKLHCMGVYFWYHRSQSVAPQWCSVDLRAGNVRTVSDEWSDLQCQCGGKKQHWTQ